MKAPIQVFAPLLNAGMCGMKKPKSPGRMKKFLLSKISLAKQTQGTKLFIAPEIKVKPGSKIVVEQNGVTTEYSASGVPAVYPSHVEIKLELFRGWA